MRDLENRNQQLKIKFLTLNKTSALVMKKIIAITFKLKRQYVSNADLTIEYEKLSSELAKQMMLMQKLQHESNLISDQADKQGLKKIRIG